MLVYFLGCVINGLDYPPQACRFHPRCPYRTNISDKYEPPLTEIHPGHWAKCWLYLDHPEKEGKTLAVNNEGRVVNG